jgi:hypothetical protein
VYEMQVSWGGIVVVVVLLLLLPARTPDVGVAVTVTLLYSVTGIDVLCRQTVQGMVIVVTVQVGQGITTVVVIGIWVVVRAGLLDDVEAGTLVVVVVVVVDAGGAVVLIGGMVVVLLDTGFTEEDDGQAELLTPEVGFFVGIPGTLRTAPIISLSQLVLGLALSRSVNGMPKLSAILTP